MSSFPQDNIREQLRMYAADITLSLADEFKRCFQDFADFEKETLFSFPFSTDSDDAMDQLQLIDLQCDSECRS